MDSKKIDCIEWCVDCDSVGIQTGPMIFLYISLIGWTIGCVLQKAGFSWEKWEKEVDWFGVTFQPLHASTASYTSGSCWMRRAYDVAVAITLLDTGCIPQR